MGKLLVGIVVSAGRAQWAVHLVHEKAWRTALATLARSCNALGFTILLYALHALELLTMFFLGPETGLKVFRRIQGRAHQV